MFRQPFQWLHPRNKNGCVIGKTTAHAHEEADPGIGSVCHVNAEKNCLKHSGHALYLPRGDAITFRMRIVVPLRHCGLFQVIKGTIGQKAMDGITLKLTKNSKICFHAFLREILDILGELENQ